MSVVRLNCSRRAAWRLLPPVFSRHRRIRSRSRFETTETKLIPSSGIVTAAGDFDCGDAVLITDRAGAAVARGLTNYARADVELIRGHKSSEFPGLLKTESYYDEVIHRDDLVLAPE